MTKGITQTRKATIYMRKEQSELVKQRADMSELLESGQRDFEIAVRHTKNLIQKEKDQLKEERGLDSTDFLSTDENSVVLIDKGQDPSVEYKEEHQKETLEYL